MRHRRAAMEAHDHTGDLGHQGGRQLAGESHLVEQPGLVEPDHGDNRLEEWPLALEDELAVTGPVYAPHAEIEPGRRQAVQLDLLSAGAKPELGRGEVDVGIVDRPLHLAGAIAGHEYARDMRLDLFNRSVE